MAGDRIEWAATGLDGLRPGRAAPTTSSERSPIAPIALILAAVAISLADARADWARFEAREPFDPWASSFWAPDWLWAPLACVVLAVLAVAWSRFCLGRIRAPLNRRGKPGDTPGDKPGDKPGEDPRRRDIQSRARWARRAHVVVALCRWNGVILFAAGVALGAWLDAVRAVLGDPVLIDELVTISPLVLLLAAETVGLAMIDRPLREALILRRLDAGEPLPDLEPVSTIARRMFAQRVLVFAIPLALAWAWSEFAGNAAEQHAAPRLGPDEAEVIAAGASLLGVAVLYSFMPLLLARLWTTTPLRGTRAGDVLDELSSRYRTSFGRVLLWRTPTGQPNAAVAGVFPFARVTMLSDGLLDALPERELRAVAGHELAHLVRRHLVWTVGALLSSLSLGGLLGSLIITSIVGPLDPVQNPALLDPDSAESQLAGWGGQVIASAVAIAFGFAVFGIVSRRFEWQADAFAARVMRDHRLAEVDDDPRRAPGPKPHAEPEAEPEPDPKPEPEPEPDARSEDALITADDAEPLINALSRIVQRTGVNPRAFTWRHGSIRGRQLRLSRLAGHDPRRLTADRSALICKLLIAASVITQVAGFTLL